MGSFTDFVAELVGDVLFVPQCRLCDRPVRAGRPAPGGARGGREFCADCVGRLGAARLEDPWHGMGHGMGHGRDKTQLPIFAWGRYDGSLKRAIAAMKYEAQPRLADRLGQWVGEAWLEAARASDRRGDRPAIVPIPLHARKLKARGFNQAERLAAAFCHTTGLPLRRRALVRIKDTAPQFQLAPGDRQRNLAGAFRLGPELARAPAQDLLLFDDIYTSGATATEAIATLRAAGHRPRAIIVLARAGIFGGAGGSSGSG